jgi:hypothetical protein
MTKIACAASSLLVLGAAVVACGPDFRCSCWMTAPVPSAIRPPTPSPGKPPILVTPADKLQADEGSGYEQAAGRPDDPHSLRMIEKGQLEAHSGGFAGHARRADGQSAYAAGAALPPAIRLYTAGAQDFRANALAAARQRFEAVLALPPQQASERAVWAASCWAACTPSRAAAPRPSPVSPGACAGRGRCARSAGAGRGQLRRTGAAMLVGRAVPATGPISMKGAIAARPSRRSISKRPFACMQSRPHAAQAAPDSLTALAAWSLGHADTSAALIDDPVAQRLLVAYALARVGDLAEGSGNGDSYYDPSAPNSGSSGYPDAARSPRSSPTACW